MEKLRFYFSILIFQIPVLFITAQKSVNQRIEQLIKEMTIEEKFGQLNLIPYYVNNKENIKRRIAKGEVGSLLKSNGTNNNMELQKVAVEQSRLHIPIMFQEDVIHGYKTIAPVPLGEAASWDMEAIEQSASVAALEASASGIQLTYAPMVDICRDPRWGRIMEGAGEDPYLGGQVAAARVKGFQGKNYRDGKNVMACAKHFTGYGAALSGRDYAILDYSERDLRETYLPPFQAAINAGVGSIMNAYTTYDATPLGANKFLLKDVLRKEMGFNGLLITDWCTTSHLVEMGICENQKDAAVMALNAGVDQDMTDEIFVKEGPELVKSGKISIVEVDRAVRNVLKAKFDLGLFDDPYKYFDTRREKTAVFSVENLEKSRDMARKSMVLLKNEGQLLPISKSLNTIALIGPLAKDKKNMMGSWNCMGDQNDVVSLYQGIKNKITPQTKLLYSEGVKLNGFNQIDTSQISEAVALARKADVVILAIGEQADFSGEGCNLAGLHITPAQEMLVQAIRKVGTPIITVLYNGRPLVLTQVAQNSDALLEAWLPGTTAGDAVSDILFGDYNPSGKLPVTFPAHLGQIPTFYAKRKNQGETGYVDIDIKPLYPFGYGLSYTKFEYADIQLSSSHINMNGTITASVNIRNTGRYEGREVVQLYIADLVCSITRPSKELKHFSIIELKPGETKSVSFRIDINDLSFIGKDLKKTVESGKFKVYIGTNSDALKEAQFELLKSDR